MAVYKDTLSKTNGNIIYTEGNDDEKTVDIESLRQLSTDSSHAQQQELKQLKEWKEQIGIPAQQNKDQLLADNARLTEQNKVLSLEIQTYREEVHKLKNDNKDISEELQSRDTNLPIYLRAESKSIQSLQQKETELFALRREYEALKSEAIQEKQQKEEWIRKYNEVQKQNELYSVLVDKLQKEELSLKDKVHREAIKSKELQDKFGELNMQFYRQQSLNNHTVDMAHELQSEVSYLNKLKRTTSLQRIDSNEALTFRYDSEPTTPMEVTSLRGNHSNGFFGFQRMISNSGSASNSVRNEDLAFVYGNMIRSLSGGDEPVPYVPSQINHIEFEKHKQELVELKEQMVEYKKALLLKNKQLAKLQKGQTDEVNARTRYHQHNPNNQQDMSKCKVFGWKMW
eukprot:234180_1